MRTVDFNCSFIRFRVDSQIQPLVTTTHVAPTTVNNVRINLECRCELNERSTGRSQVFALGASCKTERVGSDRDLWLEPNADFCLAASEQEYMILKSWARRGKSVESSVNGCATPRERQAGPCRDAFAAIGIQIKERKGLALQSLDELIEAVDEGLSIVSRTEYDDGDFHVVIDHPVKTINYSRREQVFQTDTGPILLPTLTEARLGESAHLIECFDLAYSAFNATGWAEFITNVPTPIGGGMFVDHYSQPRRLESVSNKLTAVVGGEQSSVREMAGGRKLREDKGKVLDRLPH